MILFLLQKDRKAFNPNLSGLFMASMESAASIKEYGFYYKAL